MTRSEKLWEKIKQQVLTEELITEDELVTVSAAVIESRIASDDWKLAMENTLLRRAENAE